MTAWPVSPAVNNVRNDNPRLIEPIGEAEGEDREQRASFE
jgi:hypothetical protein